MSARKIYCPEINTEEFNREYSNPPCVFALRDGRVVIFLGWNNDGWYCFLHVDNMLIKQENTLVDGKETIVTKFLNSDIVIERLDDSILYLKHHCDVSDILTISLKLPKLSLYLGTIQSQEVLQVLSNMCMSQGIRVNKNHLSKPTKRIVVLKRCVVYEYEEYYYLYIGKYNLVFSDSLVKPNKKINQKVFLRLCKKGSSSLIIHQTVTNWALVLRQTNIIHTSAIYYSSNMRLTKLKYACNSDITTDILPREHTDIIVKVGD